MMIKFSVSPMKFSLVIFGITGCFLSGTSATEMCIPEEGFCEGPNCERQVACEHGTCAPDGSCVCYPCFSGESCQKYVDTGHYPYFLKTDDTIYIDPIHEGMIYHAKAIDEDTYKTCRGDNLLPCPCGQIFYEIMNADVGKPIPFHIEKLTGKVWLKESATVEDGDTFNLNIIATNYNEGFSYNSDAISLDDLKLKVIVQESNLMEQFLKESEYREHMDESYPMDEKYKMDTGIEVTNLHSGSRVKREAFATERSNLNFTLDITNGPINTPIRPGQSIDFTVTVILPEIKNDNMMDLKVELYVMDTISGITTMALCNPVVTQVGTMIKKPDATALIAEDVNIETFINEEFGVFYDRATLSFGSIYNDDVSGNSGDYTDSSIEITFTAIMVSNTNYLNDSAIVTAGAEYDGEQYVWVSQTKFSMDPAMMTYNNSFAITGPDTFPEKSAGQFDIEAYLVDPFTDITLEVFSPNNIHDRFSITSLRLIMKGDNHACNLGSGVTKSYESVSGLTYHRMTMAFKTLVKGLDYANNLVGENVDEGNKMEFSFTILAYDAKEGDEISVGVSVSIGSNMIWSSFANITIDAPQGTIPEGPPTGITVSNVDTRTTNPEVGVGQTAVHKVKLPLHTGPGSLTTVTCTATPTSPNKICGVSYGESGKYAATFPDLYDSTNIQYSDADGSATWSVAISRAFSATNNDDDAYVVFEVTVLYKDPTQGASIDCNGNVGTFTATNGTIKTLDVEGVVTAIGAGQTWYAGSTAAIVATLKFPANGIPYSSMLLETSGDFLQTSFGSRVCSFEFLHIGRGVQCIARNASQISDMMVYKKSLSTSIYDDSIDLHLGESCGAYVSSAATADNEVTVRVVYDVPLGQAGLADGTMNTSIGAMFDGELIWTGWDIFNFIVDPPAAPDSSTIPIVEFKPPTDSSVEKFRTQIIKVYIKTYPGSVGRYKVKATSTTPDIIGICKIVFLNIGRNFACMDDKPYGKHLNEDQSIKLVHDSNSWGLSAELDLWAIRNVGSGDIYPSPIPDKDTIEIGIIFKGDASGDGTILVHYEDGRASPVPDESFTLTFTDHGSISSESLSLQYTGFDGTLEYYENVMKQLNVSIVVPPGYDKTVVMEITNSNMADVTLCIVAVTSAEDNVPCVIPSTILSEKRIEGENEIIKLDFNAICHYQVTRNLTGDNKVNVLVGLMPNKGLVSASINVVLIEGGASGSPETITITPSADEYVPGNYSMAGFDVFSANDTDTPVMPGWRIWQGVYVSLPPYVTVPVEMAVMTTSTNGRAHATVHGFRFGETQGINIGCLEDMDRYSYNLLQNSSVDGIPMVHESQTDSLGLDLKYLTNTGVTYMQMSPQPEDDRILIEADVWIADHEEVVTGDVVTISYSFKFGSDVVVLEKNLTIEKPASPLNEMKLKTEFFFTDPTVDLQKTFISGEKLGLTGRMQHVVNESFIEAYDARIRILFPPYIQFANDSFDLPLMAGVGVDSLTVNISATTVTSSYVQMNIDYLFFTDIVEFNLTMTVDPYETMPKGLGDLNSTAILRLVCRESSSTATPKYCGETAFVNYVVEGTECSDDLLVSAFDPCQFKASSAIDETLTPEKAASSVDGEFWSPAVRDSSLWKHHISVDFLRRVRITKVTFASVAGKRSIKHFKLQQSYDGMVFIDVCKEIEYIVAGDNLLPSSCRVTTRFVRLIIMELDDPDETKAIAVRFNWYGCPIKGEVLQSCKYSVSDTPLTTDASVWRHSAYDSTNDILYFCDARPDKDQMRCFSSADGNTWNVLPSYIGSLAGYDSSSQKMYAYDLTRNVMVTSVDGKGWNLVDTTFQGNMNLVDLSGTVKAIPGKDKTDLSVIDIDNGWTADFEGIAKDAAIKVKWGNCCG